jgi:UDP-3-O-[3-hydroxymyristoyl] N-acetylglucosamine deacetylase/3-hydroxyacyl-[acyl-carrier-protein] dehydratase
MLDIVGDLSLLGRPIHGHHCSQTQPPRRIANWCGTSSQMRSPLRAAQTFAPPPAPDGATADEFSVTAGALNIEQLMKLLPHRHPFLMVDRILKIEGNRIVGLKNVSINEPFFQGHFPGHPIMPGVLQLEAIAQVAGVLLLKTVEAPNQVAYFMSAEYVKWRKPVIPGDTLIIDVEMTRIRGKIGKAKGVCKVGNEVVSEANVTFMLLET